MGANQQTNEPTLIEYRVRKLDRFVITRYEQRPHPDTSLPSGSIKSIVVEKGTYDRPDLAFEIAYALCKDEHDRLGWPVGDERIQYPKGDPRYPAEIVGVEETLVGEPLQHQRPSRDMRAKMRITQVKRYPEPTIDQMSAGVVPETTQETLTFHAVSKSGSYPSDGSDEDNSYARFSPQGAVTLTVANPALLGKFEIGDTFYLDFLQIKG